VPSPGTAIAAVVAALRLGLTQGGVISLSADAGEECFTAAAAAEVNSVLQAARRHRVTVTAPLWAAVIALADQYAGRDLGFVNPALYRIGRSTSYHQAFHDTTTGNNTVQNIAGYQAAPGWDPVTGWGSPDAQVLVPLLARP